MDYISPFLQSDAKRNYEVVDIDPEGVDGIDNMLSRMAFEGFDPDNPSYVYIVHPSNVLRSKFIQDFMAKYGFRRVFSKYVTSSLRGSKLYKLVKHRDLCDSTLILYLNKSDEINDMLIVENEVINITESVWNERSEITNLPTKAIRLIGDPEHEGFYNVSGEKNKTYKRSFLQFCFSY